MIRTAVRLPAIAALCFLPAAAAAQPPTGPPAAGPRTLDAIPVLACEKIPTTKARFVAKFASGEWTVSAPAATPRLTDRDRVEVCVEHFNYLRYSLKFDVAEQQSESYAYLTKLWASILSPSIGGLFSAGKALAASESSAAGPVTADDKLVDALRRLFVATRNLDEAVSEAGRPYVKTGLTHVQAEALGKVLNGDGGTTTGLVAKAASLADQAEALDTLVSSNTEAFGLIYGNRREMYRAVTTFYGEVSARAAIFVGLADKSIGSEVKKVGKKNAGTRVTFTLVAVDGGGAATPMEDVTYFVQSNMPLVAHGGLSFSGLNDVTFEKVKRAGTFGEEELFQQQSDADQSTGFTLFLGWQFYGQGTDAAANRRESRFGAALSLGTDIRRPGARVFVGPSVILFNRFVLSGGGVFGKENAPEGSELEPNVFKIISSKPKGSWFFGISTKVY